MKRFWSIFQFESMNYIKNKVFLGITLFLIVVIGIVLSFPRISEFFASDTTTEEKAVIALGGVTDAGDLAYFQHAMPDKTVEMVEKSADELKQDVDKGVYESAVFILEDHSYQYIVKNIGMYDTTQTVVNEVMKTRYQALALSQLGANEEEIAAFLSAAVSGEVVQTHGGKDQLNTFFYTYILMIALYMLILLYGQFVAMSVATEKSSRAMELLITSANPKHFMFGKILGAGCAGLMQFILIFGSAYGFYQLNAGYYADQPMIQSIFNMPLSILLYALMFLVLGFFLYAFLYGALGSMVSRIEQMNTAVMPVTFLFVFAFMAVVFSMSGGAVDSTFMKVLSYIPFISPMAMFVRIAMGNVTALGIVFSVVFLMATALLVGYLAAGIYRMGVLMYGQPPKIKEMVKMLKESKQ